MKCPKCGYENAEDAAHCNLCGEVLLKVSRKEADFTLDSSLDFNEKYATFGKRCSAFIIDYIIVRIIRILSFAFFEVVKLLAVNIVGNISLLILWLYFILCEISYIQATPGKMLFGIKVVNNEGGRISLKQALLRAVTKGLLISGLPFLKSSWFTILSSVVAIILFIPLKQYKQGLLNAMIKTFIVNKEGSKLVKSLKTGALDTSGPKNYFRIITAFIMTFQIIFVLFLLFSIRTRVIFIPVILIPLALFCIEYFILNIFFIVFSVMPIGRAIYNAKKIGKLADIAVVMSIISVMVIW